MNSGSINPFVGKVLLRQTIGSVRLVVALFTITAAITKLLYDHFLPYLKDLDVVRWTIIGFGCVFFLVTYQKHKRGILVSYFLLFLYLCTLVYVIAFVILNRFDPSAVTILILVVGASSVIINSLIYYGVQCGIIILASVFAYSSSTLPSENFVAFLNLMIALAVFAIVVTVRLKLIARVRDSHATLEKLNVLSIVANPAGDIIFISPSVHHILGYDSRELMKDGWWKLDNLREGWINRDYILNYPNILPKEIVSLETSVESKEGKKVWFSWVNSMLPNGNYVGVGLDVTKYKQPQNQ